MPIIKRILVGIDGSDRSYKAASYAAEIASRFTASVTLMFVAADTGTYTDRFAAKPTYVPNEDILAGEKLDRARKIMDESKVPYDAVVELGNPAQMLLERSRQGYDLVVVGSRGLSGIQEFLMGSVSARVVHHSAVPVLVIP